MDNATHTHTPAPVALFVGLGNPGSEYANTRHNVGQWFLQALVKKMGITLVREGKLNGYLGRMEGTDYDCRLLVPDVYMNCSGSVVKKVTQFYKIPPQAVCIIHDDLDLPAGTIRLKYAGGHGGHNGLRDIIQQLGTHDFQRLRIGISHPGDKRHVTNFVLKPPSADDATQIQEAIESGLAIVPELLGGDLAKAMRLLHQPRLD